MLKEQKRRASAPNRQAAPKQNFTRRHPVCVLGKSGSNLYEVAELSGDTFFVRIPRSFPGRESAIPVAFFRAVEFEDLDV
ncbi:hypothetical protein HPB50_019436 [Hyalomma asiaticum]|uniref:Uncharacterized protein n=1 Tax=Hyalomma asiaticum TaxID=266040 RepID=A0ACB7RRW4_HYAAI|nr:hypothetical protein HPB50_019436 [Hyalomma asiaticum]